MLNYKQLTKFPFISYHFSFIVYRILFFYIYRFNYFQTINQGNNMTNDEAQASDTANRQGRGPNAKDSPLKRPVRNAAP